MSESDIYKTPSADLRQDPAQDQLLLHDPRKRPMGAGFSWISVAWSLFKRQPGLWIGMWVVWMMILIFVSMIPLVSIVVTLFNPVFIGGLMLAASKTDRTSGCEFSDLFSGFKQNTGSLIILGAIQLGLSIVAIIVAMGLAPLLGWKIHTVTVLLPVILLAVANDLAGQPP